ncbi:MAG: thiolase C-terminal domain-containing protein, partial [Candidatus Promineifilaceae bacterium]
ALNDAGLETADSLYVSNMLADELQGQKHLGALIADEAGLSGIEALNVRAATASGAAALRAACQAVASGMVETALVVGVEKMSAAEASPVLAKALDAEFEVPVGATVLNQIARLMAGYLERYRPPADALAHFSVNAHANAAGNPYALYCDRQYSPADVLASRLIEAPIRLLDCAPICDGAAALLLAPAGHPRAGRVRLVGSAAATDRFRLSDRPDPLRLRAIERSTNLLLEQAGVRRADIDLFEAHDAFSITACLSLEAAGFAAPGTGWQLALAGEIAPGGRLPMATLGGLKARGHPIGATAIYQACEIGLQLTGRAGSTQVPGARLALMQSIGGIGATAISHLFSA